MGIITSIVSSCYLASLSLSPSLILNILIHLSLVWSFFWSFGRIDRQFCSGTQCRGIFLFLSSYPYFPHSIFLFFQFLFLEWIRSVLLLNDDSQRDRIVFCARILFFSTKRRKEKSIESSLEIVFLSFVGSFFPFLNEVSAGSERQRDRERQNIKGKNLEQGNKIKILVVSSYESLDWIVG